MNKVCVVFGTRPEAIKLAPVVRAFRKHPGLECNVCVTAQHRQMLDQVLEAFDIVPDADFNLMRPNQTLASLTASALESLDQHFAAVRPHMVLVQGDTTTVLAATLAAFYRHIPVGHVEAGLRTGNLQAPWPEEANRVLTTRLATLHFAPTDTARTNLLAEGVRPDRVYVTGNTVVDALLLAKQRIRQAPPEIAELPTALQPKVGTTEPRVVLITGHRRESFGEGFENICRAISRLASAFPDVHFVYPVHLNPNVREPVQRILAGGTSESCRANIHLLEPLPYLPFVALMERSYLVLTDSGGIQEEAPSLGKPVLVMRATTERPEAVQAGTSRLVGTNQDAIMEGVSELLQNRDAYERMAGAANPYGDGIASERIVQFCAAFAKDISKPA